MASREQLRIIRAARAGDGSAQLVLGQHYLFGGQGLPQNFATALHWLDRAAQQDMEDAWLLIGRHISFDVARYAANMRRLLDWYEKAFGAGVMQAGLVLAQLVHAKGNCLDDPLLRDKAMHALQAAAQAGIADAQWLLSQLQGKREEPAVPPPEKSRGVVGSSLEWTAAAAEAGVEAARHVLAERAWALADYASFLRWSLPLARDLIRRSAPASS